MGNISHRIGTESTPEQIKEALCGKNDATETLERFTAHLAANGIDLKKTRAILGPWLKMDTDKEKFIDGFGIERANELLTRAYRKPFVVPENV